MSKIELSIHQNYVPTWGVWEGVREIIQNALDENTRGNKISVKHKNNELTVGNEGSELQLQHLLIGLTTKADDAAMRGEKGEGLDLGLLALARAGYSVEVRTPTETWVPEIAFSEKWGHNVLFINTRSVQKRRSGTYITIKGISESEWANLCDHFLDFHSHSDEEKIRVDYYGELLTNPRYSGRVFVKGIYVQSDPELRYGYNLFNVSLDRDRRMVDGYNLTYNTGKILSGAISRFPDRMTQEIWGMLNSETKDVSGINQWTVTPEMSELISRKFRETHGEESVPVANMGDSEEMRSFGHAGIVAPRALRDVVAPKIEGIEAIREKMSKSTEAVYSWDDLTDAERDITSRVCSEIDAALEMFRGNVSLCRNMDAMDLFKAPEGRTINMLKVVDFRKEGTCGLYKQGEDEILIARKCLRNYHVALRVAVHEVAHHISKESDATIAHQATTESLFTAILFSKQE